MKKLSSFFAVMTFVLLQTVMSQDITLKFTGISTTGNYVRLDSVQVRNVSRYWTETVVYPDTVLRLQTNSINEAQSGVSDITAYPNPFNGVTNVALTLPQNGDVTMRIYNLSGQKVAESTMSLEAGKSFFEIRLKNPQVYLLAVTTPQGCSTIKLLNRSSSNETGIFGHGTMSATEKLLSSQQFNSGDVLKIVGYSTYNGTIVTSREVLQPQTASENFTLFFTLSAPVIPVVYTDTISNITDSTAVCGGNVTSDGGATIIARGVCWDTLSNPTVTASHTTNGVGTGSFTSHITGLFPNTTYYVRAYATNSVGTAYGNVVTFTTAAILPTVTTIVVSNISDTSAESGGIITSGGGTAIISRGVCWDTAHNPTISGNHTSDSTGIGSFSSILSSLSANTTYYVRAYATNSAGTAYGNEVSFTTAPHIPTGALRGVFSVSSNKKVWFSKGNLQYTTTGTHTVAGGDTVSGTWRFAEHQWDTIGSANRNISPSYTGWIDLFGWATSGYHNPEDILNTYYQPYDTSTAIIDSIYNANSFGFNQYGYGPSSNMPDTNLIGTSANYDWGVYNAISNGGNAPGLWRTLSIEEWDILLNYRYTSSGIRYAFAYVNGVPGAIIVPDNWDTATYVLNGINSHVAYNSNVITAAQWETLENAGCVFLPVAGERTPNGNIQTSPRSYWSSTNYGNRFGSSALQVYGWSVGIADRRYIGSSVRLVQDTVIAVLPTVTTSAANYLTDITASSGGTVTNDGGATVYARGVCWSTSHNPTINDFHTTNTCGTGAFTSYITGLNEGTTYYIRAYATNSAGTAYGNEVTYIANTSVSIGALPHTFTVGTNKRVRFSRGNLQYTTTGTHTVADGGTASGTWRFAPNQWDTIGAANRNTSSSYSGWIDLFGWGTSGWNSGANAYQPYSTNLNINYYCPGGSYYNNLTGAYANADWGVYNAISNGGNQPGLWRTLTQGEWDTLINIRITNSGIRNAKATVNGVPGLIIVPDNWSATTYTLNFTNNYNSNVISSAQWATLENAGCAFLPAAGIRDDSTTVHYVGTYGDYWSSSYYLSHYVYCLYFSSGNLSAYSNAFRRYGQSVRLVHEIQSAVLPTVTTTNVTHRRYLDNNGYNFYYYSGGNVTNDGGSTVIASGVCWSTSHNPTISDSHTTDAFGLGEFTSRNLSGLNEGTTYYIRAYSTNSVGTAYGNEITLKTFPKGALAGTFSVGVNKQVYFSCGNLQYSNGNNYSNHAVAGGGTAPGVWRFAEHQWDTIGTANRNASSSYSGWIDLFGWGTSGYHNPNDQYNTRFLPYDTITSVVNTTYNYFGYGPSTNMTDPNLTGTSANYDWGVYNAISNGGNSPGMWRTPTQAEWDTLLNLRTTISGIRYAKATVNGVSGLIIVPDNWDTTTYTLYYANNLNSPYTSNVLTSSQWANLEYVGCVFLPTAGHRVGPTVNYIGTYGNYWSATYYGSYDAYNQSFFRGSMGSDYLRYRGVSVRLVKDTPIATMPTVNTTAVSYITATTALGGGSVTSDGGATVYARGVCWSTSHNPTINNSHTTDLSGIGSFTSSLTNLAVGTTYYVRAYATNYAGTAYGNEVTFTTNSIIPAGALPGSFSIGTNRRVCFSQGNLQYTTTGTHAVAVGGTAPGTWRFATNQWDTIGAANRNASSSYSGWIDLFGWGTSGYNNKHPYLTSSNSSDYGNGYANISNTNYDWGVYNSISNGGNSPGIWRTLTQAEWDTLLYYRTTTSGIRYAKATVNGVPGVIIVPDNWSDSTYILHSTNVYYAGFTTNVITSAHWSTLENAGCTFLPTAGSRDSSSVNNVGTIGNYWTSTYSNNDYAFCREFRNNNTTSTLNNRYRGTSVRLAIDVGNATLPTVTTTSASSISDSTATSGGNVSNDGGATVTARGVCWSTWHNPTISNSHTTELSSTSVFTSFISGLAAGTTYYVRAYATNYSGTAYGNEISFTTTSSSSIPSGALPGTFSVGVNKQVCFSSGNLQYTTTGTHAVAGGGTAPGTWRFAEHQYDIIGNNNGNASSSYSGWIDIFGWGTSGYHNSNDQYNTNYNPYSTSTSTVNTTYNYYGYGPSTNMVDPSLTGSSANYDWGVYNAISNGGNQPGMWRTLTSNEWNYLLFSRGTTSGVRYAKATVNGVTGLLILPDNWTPSTFTLNSTNTDTATYTTNVITSAQWTALENVGCVFLPAAGYRISPTTSSYDRTSGEYWSATHYSRKESFEMSFLSNSLGGNVSTSTVADRSWGLSVRLVRDSSTLPTVTTTSASSISDSTATSGGNVTSDGGSAVTARGVCWSTSHNPTINNSHTSNGTGTGIFTSSITGLTAGTTYYLRAYATNYAGTSYGNEVSFTTTSSVPTGALPGTFSIGVNRQVRFSQGNLQYTTTGTHAVAGGGFAPGTWRFAEHQYDVIGNNNSNISSSYSAWIDLFGWGTSGYHNSSDTLNTHYHPYDTSSFPIYNNDNFYGYGPSTNMTDPNLTGTSANYDWGVYNAISNGGNQPGMWRTLTQAEWDTLINIRTTASGIRYAKATVNGVQGLIIVPDSWSVSTYALSGTNTTGAAYTSNVITSAQWTALQNAGCAFLPAAGSRFGSTVYYVGSYGHYWSATFVNSFNADGLGFGSGSLSTNGGINRDNGMSVRLARDATTANMPIVTTSSISNITSSSATCGGNVTNDGGSTVTTRGVCWSTSHNPTISNSHTTDLSGTGIFTSSITGLTAGTTYYVRAYATNYAGTAYGNEVTFTTTSSVPTGALPGTFSVGANKQVRFSRGNLQYTTTGTHAVAGGGTAPGTWRFAPNQWDTIGSANSNASASYTGWIDLFGWGTSGYHNPNDQYNTRYQPYDTSHSMINNTYNYYGYGPSTNMIDPNLTGTSVNYDWGVYNAISNGGNQPGMWRTLTQAEWDTLINIRTTPSGIRYAMATVNGVSGIIIVPDNWSSYSYALNSTNNYDANVFTIVQWATLENAGCAFLPAAGDRHGSTVYGVGSIGNYWSATHDITNEDAYNIYFHIGYLATDGYGEERYFGLSVRLVRDATTATIPTVTTTSASSISDSTATSGGNVTSDGGSAVTARGVCWSTSHNPTISNSHTSNGTGTGSFTSSITGLTANTTYYVRAYATNSVGTAYGNEVTFTTTSSVPTGALPGTFSVGANKQVRFSRGNLQWSATGGGSTTTTHTVAGGGTAAGTWRFAPNQWDAIGSANSNISSSYSGWIDLFGWGTSGYHDSGDQYNTNYQPYSTSAATVNNTYNFYGYGPSTNMTNPDISGTNYDWGVYNAIYNPRTQTTDAPGTWRTLTYAEWSYLINTRSTTSGIRYAKATVNGVPGLIIVPDNWSATTYALNSTNTVGAAYTTNVITSAQWTTLETAGCAFLPAAGLRNGTLVSSVGSYGYCWSASYDNSSNAYGLHFVSGHVSAASGNRCYGRSVRLVRDATNATLPTVTTTAASHITSSSAVCGGEVTDEGSSQVIKRGIIFIDSSRSSNTWWTSGSGIGNFNLNLHGLRGGRTYCYIAYAINSTDTALGNLVNFRTNDTTPSVTTTAVSNITNSSATFGGNVTYDGGATVAVRGLCWSTSPNPTISDSHTTNGSGIGGFTSNITGLTSNTRYYVRAYATNSVGTAYGNEVSFTATSYIPNGALSGTFSVGTNKQVRFSRGNLQYTTTGSHAVAGGGTATGTWRFAPNQWDTIGSANSNASSSYTGWIDLFSWGTSGYHNPNDQYNTRYQPYDTSKSIVDTTYNYYGYGPSTNMTNPSLTGASANYDWGVYNAISNGGNQPGIWRTLTRSEWNTLINTRNTISGIRYAKATVNGVPGLIIVPDNWSSSIYTLNSTNTTSSRYTTNVISSSQWTTLENTGCIFLPAAGKRYDSWLLDIGSYGHYWSTSCQNNHLAHYLKISSWDCDSYSWGNRYYGYSVRLVMDVQ